MYILHHARRLGVDLSPHLHACRALTLQLGRNERESLRHLCLAVRPTVGNETKAVEPRRLGLTLSPFQRAPRADHIAAPALHAPSDPIACPQCCHSGQSDPDKVACRPRGTVAEHVRIILSSNDIVDSAEHTSMRDLLDDNVNYGDLDQEQQQLRSKFGLTDDSTL
jgi:hypothetical protein